jgi:hypothetical protein
MPRRSKLLDLPSDLREAVNQRLVAGGFAGYEALAEWLNDELAARGLELRISKSAVHRHGEQFEAKLERLRVATEQARALADGAEDDEGAMNEALVRLVQTETFDVLMTLGEMEPEQKARVMGKLNVGIARIVRASVSAKKWRQEIREKARAAAEVIKETARRSGLSDDVIRTIEEQVLGISR